MFKQSELYCFSETGFHSKLTGPRIIAPQGERMKLRFRMSPPLEDINGPFTKADGTSIAALNVVARYYMPLGLRDEIFEAIHLWDKEEWSPTEIERVFDPWPLVGIMYRAGLQNKYFFIKIFIYL